VWQVVSSTIVLQENKFVSEDNADIINKEAFQQSIEKAQQEGAFDDYDRRTNDVERGESPRKVPREQWQGILGNQRPEVLGDGRERGADVLRRGRVERRYDSGIVGMDDGTEGGEAVTASPDGVTDGIPYSVGAATPTTKFGESQLYTNTYDRILTATEKASVDVENALYAIHGETETLNNAREIVRSTLEREGNVDGLSAELAKDADWSSTDMDTAMLTLAAMRTEAAETGDFTKMNEWMSTIRERATQSAQSLQALAKWTRGTVEGDMISVSRAVDGLNEKNENGIKAGRKQKITIDPQLMTALMLPCFLPV
jgi:hypothetical protein